MARLYDPVSATFVSVDPLFAASPEKAMASPQSFNTYAYVGGNPLNYIDPLGLERFKAGPRLENDSSFDQAFEKFKNTDEGKRMQASLQTLPNDIWISFNHIETFKEGGGDTSIVQNRAGETGLLHTNGQTVVIITLNPYIIKEFAEDYAELKQIPNDQYKSFVHNLFIDRYAETIEHELLHAENTLITASRVGQVVSQQIKQIGFNSDFGIGNIVRDAVDRHLNRTLLDSYQRPSLHPRLATFQREVGTLREGLR